MKLNKNEKNAVLSVSTIISIRLLGIFLILPTFSIYTTNYTYSTHTLAGIAFGIYALAQSLLQIPYGWASDKFGRKKILIIGILVFTIGSVACALTHNIYYLIIARILQGSGAISSVAISSLGDLTRPEVRAQSFTITGIIIGFSFVIGMILGPILASQLGFQSLFYILAGLGIISLFATIQFFPDISITKRETNRSILYSYIFNRHIRRLFTSTFINSTSTNIFLFIFPLTWVVIGENAKNIWQAYLIILIPSFLIVFPYIRYAESNNKLRISTKAAWILLLATFLIYSMLGSNKTLFLAIGITFFVGHTIFQSLMPAFLTQRVPSEYRGTATGFYNLASFSGASLGGMISGYLYDLDHNYPIYFIISFLIIWIITGLPTSPGSDKS